jgi:hypothetical protein
LRGGLELFYLPAVPAMLSRISPELDHFRGQLRRELPPERRPVKYSFYPWKKRKFHGLQTEIKILS